MSVSILTPLGLLVAALGVVPFLALRAGERRARGLAHSLGLPAASPSRGAVFGIASVAVLLGLAATQPVLAVDRETAIRTDAEVYVVLDTSRSMLASRAPGAPTRFDRAKAIAVELRGEFAGVSVGVASLTDRVLPHVFPSADRATYTSAILRAMDVENPPPDRDWVGRATSYAALSTLATGNFYSRTSTSRAFVLLSDGETRPYRAAVVASNLRNARRIEPVLVHVADTGERLYVGDRVDRGYASDPGSRGALEELAVATGGVVVEEGDVERAADAVRSAIGEGARVTAPPERTFVPLAPWLIGATLIPIAFLVVRRALY